MNWLLPYGKPASKYLLYSWRHFLTNQVPSGLWVSSRYATPRPVGRVGDRHASALMEREQREPRRIGVARFEVASWAQPPSPRWAARSALAGLVHLAAEAPSQLRPRSRNARSSVVSGEFSTSQRRAVASGPVRAAGAVLGAYVPQYAGRHRGRGEVARLHRLPGDGVGPAPVFLLELQEEPGRGIGGRVGRGPSRAARPACSPSARRCPRRSRPPGPPASSVSARR